MPAAVAVQVKQSAVPAGRRAGPLVWLRRGVTAAALGGWLAIALIGGASPAGLLCFAVCCVIYLYLPGRALAAWLAPPIAGTTALFSAVYGCALLAGVHCIAVRLGAVWLLRLVPPRSPPCF